MPSGFGFRFGAFSVWDWSPFDRSVCRSPVQSSPYHRRRVQHRYVVLLLASSIAGNVPTIPPSIALEEEEEAKKRSEANQHSVISLTNRRKFLKNVVDYIVKCR
ncbi:hypothetical protein [Nitrospira sp. BLG_1]|uniref:hypothetical protein n=1 Tax=Nitrospira sp. BLG_1 TaxID=3395883 RepID=UPI0039BD625A